MNVVQVRLAGLILTAASLVACEGARDLAGPTPAVALVPTPALITITGHVTATNGGQPLGGITADLSGQPETTTDGSGLFSTHAPAGLSERLTLIGGGIVPRSIWVATSASHDVHVDAFGAGFDLAFYRKLTRDGLANPGTLQPLRHLPAAPKVYVRTVDDVGQPIDAATLDATTNALAGIGSLWTGGRFGVVSIERGTETRQGQPGWLTVTWFGAMIGGICGQTIVGLDGGAMALNYLHPDCGCNGSRIRPSAVKHELGHAFGLYHTGDAGDLMSGLGNATCDQMPSTREQLYAGFAYGRPAGNTDPDEDPADAQRLASLIR